MMTKNKFILNEDDNNIDFETGLDFSGEDTDMAQVKIEYRYQVEGSLGTDDNYISIQELINGKVVHKWKFKFEVEIEDRYGLEVMYLWAHKPGLTGKYRVAFDFLENHDFTVTKSFLLNFVINSFRKNLNSVTSSDDVKDLIKAYEDGSVSTFRYTRRDLNKYNLEEND